LFGLALWSSIPKYSYSTESKEEKNIKKNLHHIYSQIRNLSAQEELLQYLSEENQNNSSKIASLLTNQLPRSTKSSIYLWRSEELQYWSSGVYELYFELLTR